MRKRRWSPSRPATTRARRKPASADPYASGATASPRSAMTGVLDSVSFGETLYQIGGQRLLAAPQLGDLVLVEVEFAGHDRRHLDVDLARQFIDDSGLID